MDINLLALNIGNSRLAVGVFEAGELTHVARVPIDRRGEWGEALRTAWDRLNDKDAAIVGASVNPSALEAVEHLVQQTAAQRIAWVGRDIDLPIEVLIDEPNATGVDRVLNVAAAYEQMGKTCVVVDAGTALTINVCNDAGEFLGGAIAPGASMMLEALHEKTAKLPLVNLD